MPVRRFPISSHSDHTFLVFDSFLVFSPIRYLTLGPKAPTKPAVYSAHEQIARTYQQLNDDVDRVANSLLNDFELKKGDVLALWSANSYAYILILYAGGPEPVFLPLNLRSNFCALPVRPRSRPLWNHREHAESGLQKH